jgi:hypothetical protein
MSKPKTAWCAFLALCLGVGLFVAWVSYDQQATSRRLDEEMRQIRQRHSEIVKEWEARPKE